MVRVRSDVREGGVVSRRRTSSTVAEAPQEHQRVAPSVGLRIHRLILHALDPRANNMLLVDDVVTLDDQSALFFAGHIEAAEQRADWHARFREPDGEVPKLCRQLLGDPGEFVAASRLLAERLYNQ